MHLGKFKLSAFSAFTALILITLISFSKSTFFEFTYDDEQQIVANPYVISKERSLNHFLSVFSFPTREAELYRPVVTASYRLNFLLDGLRYWHFHLVNLIIYIATVLLLFVLCREYFKNIYIAFISALIFALHPVHVESVVNISGRAELLAAFFFMIALYLCLRVIKTNKFLLIVCSGVLFFLACLSKESALTGLVIAPIFLYYGKFADKKLIFKTFLIWLSFALLYLSLRAFVLGQVLMSSNLAVYYIENPLLKFSFAERILPSFYILGNYLKLLILPLNLSADYAIPAKLLNTVIFSPYGIFCLSLFVTYLILLCKLRNNLIFPFLSWFFAALLLTSNLFVPIGTFAGDRLLYLPSAGFAASLGYLLYKLFYYRKFAFYCFFPAYILLLATITNNQIPLWENNIRLFTAATERNQYSQKAPFVLGVNYLYQKNFHEAEKAFLETLRRDPDYYMAMQFLSLTYLNLGDKQKSAHWYSKYEKLSVSTSN